MATIRITRDGVVVVIARGAGEPVGKPFVHEHAARQTDPKGYERFRRKELAPGVQAIIGFKAGGGSEVQSVRFDADKFTPEQARTWLREHDLKSDLEEAMAKVARVILKSTAARKTLYAIAMRPGEADAHGEVTSKEEVRKACQLFMGSGEINLNHAGAAHGLATLVENFLAYADSAMMHGEPVAEPLREGDWIIGVHLDHSMLADHPEAIEGVSIEGLGTRRAIAP